MVSREGDEMRGRASLGKKRRRARRIRAVCKLIVWAALIFILVSLSYAMYYMTVERDPLDPELAGKLQDLAEYYGTQGGGRNQQNVCEDGQEEPVSDGEGALLQTSGDMQKNEFDVTRNVAEEIYVMEETDINRKSETAENATAGVLRESINALSLNPRMPETQRLQELLDEIMPQITMDCTDTYDRIRACYDYLINSCSYSQTTKYDYEYDAYLLLTEYKGSCTYYVAALYYMLQYIGVDSTIVNGYRYVHPGEGSKASFHRWIEVTLDGISYVLDPQWEDTLSHGGDILYERFFMTHVELAEYYDFEE